MGGIDLIITITDRSKSEQFISLYQREGIPTVLSVLGHGTATGEVLDYLGLEATEKAMLICMTPQPKTKQTIQTVAKEMWLDVPGNGVLMTVPVSSICGSAKNYLVQEQPEEAEEQAMEKGFIHELIIVIVNQGHTDFVMDAARSAGATGGTAIHAKGTGGDFAKKFFGVSIASEKEMVFILAKGEDKKNIMEAIMTQAGLQSQAQSIVFSLPVSNIAGLRQLDDAQ